MEKARIGFIGAGGFSTGSIYPNICRLPFIDLVSICDIDEEKANRNARNFGARRVYTDRFEMLDKEELDGVFCIGPAPQQYELAPCVLERGIPVYVEKPSANTSAEAKELAEIGEANNTWGQVGFMKRFAAVYTQAKEIIAKEDFGELHMVKVKFGQGPYPQIWGIDSARRAMLIGQLCHIFDLVRFFGGNPQTVHAFYREATPTQFAYTVNVKFESGVIGLMDLNALDHKAGFRDIHERLELVGFESNICCEDMIKMSWQAPEDFLKSTPHTGRYVHSFDPSWTGINQMKKILGYEGEVEHFAKKCIGQAEGGPDLWDSYHSLKFGEAVYESAFEGGEVEVYGE
ncbi:MAG: Gfo/Idh/MocA family oxidoreductase [Planctomycetota bacterium]|jgi:predicted dehydrogenase|nr:Gfo/Idh/MocA family oxidoreductase [Planctomycetota bacterium]